MTVLRHPTQVHLPPDFGVSLAVIAFLGGLVLVVALAVSAMPTQGPRTENRPPEAGTTYTEMSAPAPASPVASH